MGGMGIQCPHATINVLLSTLTLHMLPYYSKHPNHMPTHYTLPLHTLTLTSTRSHSTRSSSFRSTHAYTPRMLTHHPHSASKTLPLPHVFKPENIPAVEF